MDSGQRPRLTPVVRPVEQPDPLLLRPPLPSPPRALLMLVCTGRSWALGVPRTLALWPLKPLLWCEDRARGGVQGTSCPEGSSALAPSSWAPSFHREARRRASSAARGGLTWVGGPSGLGRGVCGEPPHTWQDRHLLASSGATGASSRGLHRSSVAKERALDWGLTLNPTEPHGINKVLLEQSHVHLSMSCRRLLLWDNGREHMACKA